MNKTVICISGRIGSGKSTLCTELSSRLNCVGLSVSDYLIHLAIQRGLAVNRHTLQTIGEEEIQKGWNKFCTAFLKYAGRQEGQSIVIGGIRHIDFFKEIKNIVKPLPCFLVFLEIDPSVRKKRLFERDKEQAALTNEEHSTESYYDDLVRNADFVFDTSIDSPVDIANKIISISQMK